MNMFKKNGGFTLVELIVVIAILAILAAVAIPAYSGYITKAQDASATTTLGSIKTACQGALAKETGTVSKIVVAASEGVVTKVTAYIGSTPYVLMSATANEEHAAAADFDLYVGTISKLSGSYVDGATWVLVAEPTNNLKEGWNKG